VFTRHRTTLAAVAAGITLATSAGGAVASTPPGPAPERIVSLSPAATEVLFAINAGDQVVAVDSFSNYPEEAPLTELSAYEPNIEAIADYDPDLVVVDGTNPDLVAGLETLGIAVHVSPAPADLDGLYAGIEAFGAATGTTAGAAGLVEQMQAEIDAILARVPATDAPLTFYHELDSTLYSITSSTFIGQLYALAGLENIADAADPEGTSAGYPQLSAEYLLEADPDLVFLADTKCCAETAETFAARPGFIALRAVRNGDVVLLDDDIASRWGPRVVVLLDVIVTAVEEAVAEEDAAA
jgi:iron complex transport system substrate-binding protein